MTHMKIPLSSLSFVGLDGKPARLTDYTWDLVLLVFLRHLA